MSPVQRLLAPVGLTIFSLGCASLPSTPRDPSERSETEYDLTAKNIVATNQATPYFVLEGQPFCFAGTNSYSLAYEKASAVLDVLKTAVKMNLRVVRAWGFLERGSLDGETRSIHRPGHLGDVFFQYWDPEANRPAYNDGPNGLQKLDFLLHHARRLGIRLIIPLTNSWRDFGGMDQYLVWYNLDQHHLFYTDHHVRAAYRDWVEHLVGRVNSIDGVAYSEDPAIFSWELANEPRTENHEEFDSKIGWDTSTITTWAAEMSEFVKSIDSNHLVSVGDEGFFNKNGKHWTQSAEGGVDHEALTALPNVDFGTFHLYPDHWDTDSTWERAWIESHVDVARKYGKPTILEEYGVQVRRDKKTTGAQLKRRDLRYAAWNHISMKRGAGGALFWRLSGIKETGERYPDYDHFSLYSSDEGARHLAQLANQYAFEAQACAGANKADHGPNSPFVGTRAPFTHSTSH